MASKFLTKKLRKALVPLEKTLLGNDYFFLQNYLGFSGRLNLLQDYWQQKWRSFPQAERPAITFLLYSKACERMLIPLLVELLKHPSVQVGELVVNCIVLGNIHQLRLSPHSIQQLKALNCPIQTHYLSLIQACQSPAHQLVVACLDHRGRYEFHKCGVETIDQLKAAGVKTICIQHGGTRADSVTELASSASDLLLVWGRRIARELQQLHHVSPERLRVIGNPLHDRLVALDTDNTRAILMAQYPHLQGQLTHKKILVLATCLHTEYRGYGDEAELYRTYIRKIYGSVDFSRTVLLIKMHPLDRKLPNLYQEAAAELPDRSALCIIEPEQVELDIYNLLSIADLLLTRCSTVAEEALLLGKSVIAFDLFEQGPSMGYKHLEDYGSYRTVYASPADALPNAFEKLLFSPDPPRQSQANIIADLTLALDGKSTERGVKAILEQMLPFKPNSSTSNSKTG